MLHARINICIIVLLSCLSSGHAWAQQQSPEESLQPYHVTVQNDEDINSIIKHQVIESHNFFGLSSYYNSLRYLLITPTSVRSIDLEQEVELAENEWLAAIGRFNVFLMQTPQSRIMFSEQSISIINWPDGISNKAYVLSKNNLRILPQRFNEIRYSHLWSPFAFLARFAEASLDFIYKNVVSHWGWAVVFFAIAIKIVLFPVGIMTTRLQREISKVQAVLAPEISHIKAHYRGEEAHNLILEAYKKYGVSPFYTLKPLLVSFLQVPILVAVFNALGEMPQFTGSSFLWITDLAYPDRVFLLPWQMPMFGDSFNVLPFVMSFVALFSTIIFQNQYAPTTEVKQQKRNLYLMVLVFFVLFYPFPAVMVLYWALANILQTVQQQIIKI